MKEKETNDLRCSICRAEFNLYLLTKAGIAACPRCGTKHPPLKKAEDGYIKTNWQDIRVLAIYAQRWAATFDTRVPGNKDAIAQLKRIVSDLYHFMPPTTNENLDPSLKHPDVNEAVELRQTHRLIPSPFFKKRKGEDY